MLLDKLLTMEKIMTIRSVGMNIELALTEIWG